MGILRHILTKKLSNDTIMLQYKTEFRIAKQTAIEMNTLEIIAKKVETNEEIDNFLKVRKLFFM